MHLQRSVEVDPLVFYVTGRQPAEARAPGGLRPALLARYRDLTRLRYDFPVVLLDRPAEGAPVRSLTHVVDGLLRGIAPPGMESEQLRKMVLRIERDIRTLSAAGETGTLSELWQRAAAGLEAADEAFGKSARIASGSLDVDGTVVDCDAALPAALLTHLWSAVQEEKALAFRAKAGRLMVQLADILRADHAHSRAGQAEDALRSAIGTAHRELFDFASLSSMLLKSTPHAGLSETRRRRIESTLGVLKSQRFFPAPATQPRPPGAPEPHGFAFSDCAEAVAAYRARLPEMVALVQATTIAELEIEGGYVEGRHDVIFEGMTGGTLSAVDRAMFPDYLVIPTGALDHAAVMDALSSDAPVKIAADIGALMQDAADGGLASPRGAQLAGMATELDGVFVLQSAASNLYKLRDRLMRGLDFAGPALFSVFTGASDGALPPYLVAASAMQSRVFPAFSYDPSAGEAMAARFSLENNPQVEADWPSEAVEYADPDMQRVTEPYAFTAVDFLLCLPACQTHFIPAPRDVDPGRMLTAAQWIAHPPAAEAAAVPYVLASDENDRLLRMIADERAIAAARRCLERWHRLQEAGGVHNSHAERLLEREKARWEEEVRQAAPTVETVAPALQPAAAPVAASVEEAVAAAPARNPDEAFIETERCSTCNECTLLNDRMFAYNANKQAYIADIAAGTYAQLVEAAESCQLGIIHPGKPRNPNEPGLDDLRARAEPFL